MLTLSAFIQEATPVWDKPNPVEKSKKLSASQKIKAKARARAAGRPYPNMVDNIWAAQNENFIDGKNPEDKGDMARYGLKGKTIAQLKKIRSSESSSPRKKQLAHWFINMHKEENILEAKATLCGRCGTTHVKPEQGGTCPALSKEENARRRAKGMNESEDPREYDYEGNMAKIQLKSIIRHAQHLHDMLEDNTNLPEWVQSKITKAEDYLSGAHDYMMSKMEEDVDMSEAEKKLGKPYRTPEGPKKFAVHVKNEKGNTIKVTFGDPNLSIKRDNPERRKSFRARHNCENPGPRTKARYWSCRQWRAGAKVEA